MEAVNSELNTDSAERRTARARALLEQNRPSEAMEQCERAISLDSSFFAAYRILGLAFMRVGDFGQAVKAFEAALRIEPESAGIHAMLGLSLARLGQNEAGEREVRTALDLDPSNTHHRGVLGTVKIMGRPSPDNEDHLRELLELQLRPAQRFTILLDLVRILKANGRLEGAGAVLDTAEELAASLGNGEMVRLVGHHRQLLKRIRRTDQIMKRVDGLLAELQPLCSAGSDQEAGADAGATEARALQIARAIEAELANLPNLGDEMVMLRNPRRSRKTRGVGDEPVEL